MARSSAGFDRQITVFSPEGRLYQVEYAFKPITNSNVTAIAVRGTDNVVIACQKKVPHKLYDASTLTSMYKFNEKVGGCFVGLYSDFLPMATRCIYEAQNYHYKNGIMMGCDILANRMGSLNQVHTQIAGQRPLACCVLMMGIDEEHGAMLYKVDPAGLCVPFRATALGAKQTEACVQLERKLRKKSPSTTQETIEMAVSTLISVVGVDFKATDLEISEVSFQNPEFRKLSIEEIDEILTRIADKS